MTRTAIWWIRRDLRLDDNPALLRAAEAGTVLPVFCVDPAFKSAAGTARAAWLSASLAALAERLGGRLVRVRGLPEEVLPELAHAVDAASVHIATDFGPYGRRRDDRVRTALGKVPLVGTGSPYAVAPGTLHTRADQPFKVFTPFHRAWLDHGIHQPADDLGPADVDWSTAEIPPRLHAECEEPADLPGGDVAARRRWRDWLESGIDYRQAQQRPAMATTATSIPLRWGELHPRTMIADLDEHRSVKTEQVKRQLAWRDFFADVLWHNPQAMTKPLRAQFATMQVDDLDDELTRTRLTAWQLGRTGYPIVDAGMRQLLRHGWMHNRVRMITASFLVKDLHIGWWHGAAWFMSRLHDGDVAQNQLNWQWVAGCGTDAAPYFRVFNPTTQATRFDPEGAYIRQYVPELADVEPRWLHEPWLAPQPPAGYPGPIVDHARERTEALDRFEAIG